MKQLTCLLIHGFGGDEKEISYLGDFLKEKGLFVKTVRLAGHGEAPDLRAHGHKDWLSSVENALDGTAGEEGRAALIGFSMGGLLALHFASRPEVEKIALLNTPIYFWNLKIIARDLFAGIFKNEREKLLYYKNSIQKTPLRADIEFLKLLFKTKKRLQKSDRPVLILQCRGDETTHYKSALHLQKRLGERSELFLYDGGRHQVFCSSFELRDLWCEEVYRFLTK